VLDAHVVSHTHWDREWYQPLERFRQRLVALVDALLDTPPARGESFLLDGQAIVLEDYLAVRPERRSDLARLLAGGQLEAGPWYVLGDELIAGGEAIVRNLLAGGRVVRSLGGTPPPALYCPDSFGHPAALPAIARGFGFSVILLWRGYGSTRWPPGDAARWTAPDGSEVLLYHLPRSGYEFGSSLPADVTAAAVRWRSMRAELEPRAALGVVLVPNGADHHARQRRHGEALAALASAGRETGDSVHASSLARFAGALVDASRGATIPAVRGELRDSYGYTWTLQGTFATRAHEKRLNALAERALVREAEPWAALARVRSGSARRPLVHAAWRDLLQAHPHDTLCGCSIDAVARAMELRLGAALTQAAGVRDDALADLLGHDAALARERRGDWSPRLILRNPTARTRAGVALVQIEEFVADVAVGPGSAPRAASASDHGKPDLTDLLPGLVAQPLRTWTEERRMESPLHYPDNDLVRVTEAVVWADAMSGYATRAIPLGDSTGRIAPGKLPVTRVTARGTRMGNGLIALEIAADGSISVLDIATGRRVDRLLEITDQADAGDLYTPSPRGETVRAAVRSARITRRGPLRGEIEVRLRVPPLPAHAKWRKRRPRPRPFGLIIRLAIDAGSPLVRIHVTGDNSRGNHKLRLTLRTDVATQEVFADAAFGVVRREPLTISPAEASIEQAPTCAPLHRYVSVFGRGKGATIYSDGLAEYEAAGDDGVAVTLVRAVGDLSRNDLPERPGHAGWPTPTPDAQCLGPFETRLGLLLHGPRDGGSTGLIEQSADDVLLPLTGSTLRSAIHVHESTPGVELHGDGLAFSACKDAEESEDVVLRCVNLLDVQQTGAWTCGFSIAAARRGRLDEQPGEPLTIRGSRIEFAAAPREVVTILVTPAKQD